MTISLENAHHAAQRKEHGEITRILKGLWEPQNSRVERVTRVESGDRHSLVTGRGYTEAELGGARVSMGSGEDSSWGGWEELALSHVPLSQGV